MVISLFAMNVIGKVNIRFVAKRREEYFRQKQTQKFKKKNQHKVDCGF